MFKEVNAKKDFPKMEKELLDWWEKNGVVKKYLDKNKSAKKRFSFIDGPITANNPMGIHHAWGRTYKDLWQRYKNMQGFEQRFQNGFDCQGLWVEVEVEKELGFNSKKDIIDYGMGNFTDACKARVNKYAAVQTEQSKRLGMFMDWENSYYTMSETNNLSIWKFLKICHEKGLIYKNKSATTWCPRCETGLSQHEQADGYKEIEDVSVYFKCRLVDKENEYFLVWTTTPWTISTNVLLAINTKYDYVKAKVDDEYWYLAKDSADKLGITNYEVIDVKQLLDVKFVTPYEEIPAQKDIHHYVVNWDLVSPSDGTGIVHIAPGGGQEDYELGLEVGADIVNALDDTGHFIDGFGELSGMYAHDVRDVVLKYLEDKKLLYKTESVKHSYPHCWRCKTKCLFKLQDNWFINMQEIKPKLKEEAAKVNWMPSYAGKRMQNWLDNMEDWMISRNRFYGLSLPFYECHKCDKLTVVASKEELKEVALKPELVDKLPSLHRPWIDEIEIKCPNCGEVVKRVTDVGDCWLDAGVVPFSTLKYFEDKKYWEKWYPADFITEMIEQVRLWYYSMLVYGVMFEGKVPYLNVLNNAQVRDEDGDRISKTKRNGIPYDEVTEKMGTDVIRWLYLKQTPSSNLRFGWNVLTDAKREFLIPFWNSYSYFVTYANMRNWSIEKCDVEKGTNLLDKWVMSELNSVNKDVQAYLDKYDATSASKRLENFVLDVSTWYIRRSRNRFGDGDNAALSTMYTVFVDLAKMLAPFVPFITEEMYQNLKKDGDPESVHLCNYPEVNENLIDKTIETKMNDVREVCTLGQAARVESKMKVRQPLQEVQLSGVKLDSEFLDIVKEELNVLKVSVVEKVSDSSNWNVQENKGLKVALNTELTADLKKDGLMRDVMRKIQQERKNAGLKMGDAVDVCVVTESSEIKDLLDERNAELMDAVSASTLCLSNSKEESTKSKIFVTI
ncbi:isoleucine--tRNA ligase [Candidatus Dojkabacteria bacterium]|nr:isoleucine--tRNA ligase [Candidatus Dojkabacteria bacterium]